MLYDFDVERGCWIPLATEDEITGLRGLGSSGDLIYALYDVDWTSTRLSIFRGRETLANIADIALPDVIDPHSLWVDRERLLVTSTGRDELLAYELRDGVPEGSPAVLWRAGTRGEDTHHLNSVTMHQGDVLVSAFGLRSGEYWRTARHGYIYNVSESKIVEENLYHPHSLSSRFGELYYIESSRQALRSFGGTRIKARGYLRGCDFLNGSRMIVGTNAGRTKSKRSNLVHNDRWWYAREDELQIGSSSLAVLDLKRDVVERYFDLSAFGGEVYDILIADPTSR